MNWLPIITVSVQATLLAALALFAAAWLRSAAHRHSVLLAALLCILASPVFYVAAAWSGLSFNIPLVAIHLDNAPRSALGRILGVEISLR